MFTTCLRTLTVTLVSLASGATAPAGVRVVDANHGPGTFSTNVQSAIDASANGDLVLIRTGSYAGFSLFGKSLVISAESGANVFVTDESSISALANTQSATIRGLHFSAGTGCATVSDSAMRVFATQGRVEFEDCSFEGGSPSIWIASAVVALARCTVTGRDSSFDCLGGGPAPAGVAITCGNATLDLESCVLVGGDGAAAQLSPTIPGKWVGGNAGARALWVASGSAFVAGCALTGGDGGSGALDTLQPTPTCVGPGAGGFGLVVGTNGHVQTLDSTLASGAAGVPHAACSAPAPTPATFVEGAGSLTIIPGATNTLTASSPAREGQSVTVSIDGMPGASTLLFVGVLPGSTFVPAASTYLSMQSTPLFVVGLGNLSPSGSIAFATNVGSFLPFGAFAQCRLQCVTCDVGSGDCRFGSVSVITLLDASL